MNGYTQQDISIVIKTFQRQESLAKLLRSLKKLNCQLPILIADDSRKPYRDKILSGFPDLDIHYYVLPFDSGLSAGRNFLLKKVKTSYILVCDDDFRFDEKLNLPEVMLSIEKNELDIAGGILFNYITVVGLRRFFSVILKPHVFFRYVSGTPAISRYCGNFVVDARSCILRISNKTQPIRVQNCDVVSNFFIGRTKSILAIEGWDENFKVGEHEDFFFRAMMNRLSVALVEDLSVRHYPVATKDYLRYRERAFDLKVNFPRKFFFAEYKEIDIDHNKLLYEYNVSQDKLKPLN